MLEVILQVLDFVPQLLNVEPNVRQPIPKFAVELTLVYQQAHLQFCLSVKDSVLGIAQGEG